MDQRYINSIYQGNLGIQDSTSLAKVSFETNSAATTINVAGTLEPIAVNVDYSISSIIERFLAQDVCTLDGSLDTVNTTFNHGLSLNDRIFLNVYAGSTLPVELSEDVEYYVVNVNAQDFQLSLTESGSPIDFTGNGAGTIYYRHSSGVSRSGQLIYIGNEDIKALINS